MRIATGADIAGDQYIRSLIHRKALQLARRSSLTRDDFEDIEQELWLHTLTRISKFNPQRGNLHAFVTTVIDRHASTMLRRRRAQKRDDRHVASFSAPQVTTSGSVELGATIGTRQKTARHHGWQRSDVDQACLQADVENVLCSMPANQRRLAQRLKNESISSVARNLGIPRTTLYGALAQIRRRFQRSDLQHYLSSNSSSQSQNA